ncbi:MULTISPECIES: hypothetical protein [Rhodococcus]|uniref:Uncharacterized protein n=1 Tax=Rhodococcus opacus TaxID=37919 RepID=A0AAX3YUJ1_RHOOP|nr:MULTISPECIES: hypothetical protein [Rhodococcus]MCZ4588763.1 hypothetical protein [Rhodococcus opacus]QSE85956.1 hypothetical protein JWS14_43590 [Rhodococcus koreensis]UZG59794.1 hypothetical protein ONE62_39290 [Rhodococcus opacus]WLF51803.1 hypothetical protein Q5707_40730 [Rhodococcus opacus]WLF52400.1 hypothetical protein Q5707_44265 [Rhodococcus opacus]
MRTPLRRSTQALGLGSIGRQQDSCALHTTLFDAQWDIYGRFEQTSDVWRAASLQFNPPGEEFPSALLEMLSEDHTKFLRDLRSFDVQDSIAFDLTSGQLVSSKYLVIVTALRVWRDQRRSQRPTTSPTRCPR